MRQQAHVTELLNTLQEQLTSLQSFGISSFKFDWLFFCLRFCCSAFSTSSTWLGSGSKYVWLKPVAPDCLLPKTWFCQRHIPNSQLPTLNSQLPTPIPRRHHGTCEPLCFSTLLSVSCHDVIQSSRRKSVTDCLASSGSCFTEQWRESVSWSWSNFSEIA